MTLNTPSMILSLCAVLFASMGCASSPTTPESQPPAESPAEAPAQKLTEAKPDVTTITATRVAADGRTLEAHPVHPVWMVASGDDYIYVYGEGKADAGEFSVTLDGPPPKEALNARGFGVAVFIETTSSLKQGKCEEGCMAFPGEDPIGDEPQVMGASDRHSLIYIHPEASFGEDAPRWLREAPVGYSCGVGVPPEEGRRFDGFKLVDCAEVELRVAKTYKFVNWT